MNIQFEIMLLIALALATLSAGRIYRRTGSFREAFVIGFMRQFCLLIFIIAVLNLEKSPVVPDRLDGVTFSLIAIAVIYFVMRNGYYLLVLCLHLFKKSRVYKKVARATGAKKEILPPDQNFA